MPRTEVRSTRPGAQDSPQRAPDLIESFDDPRLDSTVWSTLRQPAGDDWLDLSTRAGWVRITGRQSLASLFDQAMIATRICEPEVVASTVVQSIPRTPGHPGGLVAWYDHSGYNYAFLTVNDDGRRTVVLESGTVDGVCWDDPALDAEDWPTVHLRFTLAGDELTFAASPDAVTWHQLGTPRPADVVSDDYADLLRFTGSFAALRVDDHDGGGFTADFDGLELRYPASRSDR